MELSDAFPNISDHQMSLFERYYELLSEWNKRINLTAIIEREEVYLKHFADSLTAIPLLNGNEKLMDIGAGAGFPSIPLKIAMDGLKMTLIDSVNKKVSFMNTVISELGLKNIRAIHTRAETLNECFDVVVARAVASLEVLVEYSLPFLNLDGRLIAYKSYECAKEIDDADYALNLLGGRVEEIREITLPHSDIRRKLVVIKKVAPTPKGYPRDKNLPRTKPLLKS